MPFDMLHILNRRQIWAGNAPFVEINLSCPTLNVRSVENTRGSMLPFLVMQGQTTNRPIHYPLFYARGNANDDPGMISISNATPLRGDNQHFIRGDNILGTFMSEEPPQTPRNRAAVDALIKELERQGYVHDPYNPHGHEWYMYKFRRIGTGK